MRFLLIFFPFMVFANVADVNIHNVSEDKNISNKALDQNVSKDFRSESKKMRQELKEYREKVYALEKKREEDLETARALIKEAKALKLELKEDIIKRNKLKERLSGVSSEVSALASGLLLGGDITQRGNKKRELAILEQQIKKKKQTVRLATAQAKKLVRERKIMKQEIAELREEMTLLKEERKAFIKRGLASPSSGSNL